MSIGKAFLSNKSTQSVAIDEVEQELLGQLLSTVFSGWEKSCLPIVHNPRGQQGKNISYVHEYLFLLYPNDNEKFISDIKRTEIDARNLRDSGTESNRMDAKNCFYPFYVRNNKIIGYGEVPPDNFHPTSANIINSDGTIEVYPLNDNGDEKKWRYAYQSVNKILHKLEVKQGRNSIQIIFNKDTGVMKSLWTDARYDASEYGTKVLQSIVGLEQAKIFSYPKSIYTVKEIINAQLGDFSNDLILDYFAGSGTTAHAVINLNREDGGKRKYILVEQGEYFDTVLKPRVQKVIYSENWTNGKPQADKDGDLHGVPQIVKVLQLESYEDTLNNLSLNRQDDVFDHLREAAQEDYLLRYMLTHESRNSLLSTDDFKHPFAYRLNIATSSVGSYESRIIDLVETFNYLLGISVQAVDDQRHDPRRQFAFIEGRLPNGENCLIIWRDCERWDYQQLPELLKKRRINPNNHEFDVIYINGDHNIPTVLQEADGIKTLKLRPIEPEFLSLMFDVEDV